VAGRIASLDCGLSKGAVPGRCRRARVIRPLGGLVPPLSGL